MLSIGVISQKGGVGKSTTARLIAVNSAMAELDTKIIDLDIQQGTCTAWNSRRMQNNICLLYTSPSPRDRTRSRMPSSA